MELLKLDSVTKSFDPNKEPVIQNISFSVDQGELITILGPSGCGKTTILRTIAGFEIPDSGDIYLAGQHLSGDGVFVPPHQRGVGMVFQNYALFPHLTVEKNILFPVKNKDDRKRILTEIIKQTNLSGLEKRFPSQLSGGQQQRVALGRALAQKPVIILLDEPFSNLDAKLRLSLRDELRDLIKQTGLSAIFITHDQNDALAISDKIIVLNEGRIEQIGTPREIYFEPQNEFVGNFIGEANIIDGTIINCNFVESELGTIKVKNSQPEGKPVRLLIRPQNIIISGDTGVRARVNTISFAGIYSKVKLFTIEKPKVQITVYAEADANLAAGQEVLVWVNDNCAHIL